MAVDATAVLDYCAQPPRRDGVQVTPGLVVGMAFHRGVAQVPEFHNRVVFGRIVPFPSYDVAFAVDIGDGDDLAPTKVRDVDTKTVVDVAPRARGGRRPAAGPRRTATTRPPAASPRAVPWFALRPMLSAASLLNGGIGVRAFGQPAHPLGSLFVTNIGSFGLDEGYVAPVPLARVPLYVCVGARVRRADGRGRPGGRTAAGRDDRDGRPPARRRRARRAAGPLRAGGARRPRGAGGAGQALSDSPRGWSARKASSSSCRRRSSGGSQPVATRCS